MQNNTPPIIIQTWNTPKTKSITKPIQKSSVKQSNNKFSKYFPKCQKCGRMTLFLNINEQGICRKCENNKIVNELQNKIAELQTPEYQNLDFIRAQITQKEEQLATLDKTIAEQQEHIKNFEKEISEKKKEIVSLDETINIQSFGMYDVNYEFLSVEKYKLRLTSIREQQKAMIKADTAATGATTWTVDGNLSKGKKMVNDTKKLLLRAFNTECDELVSKVKFNNYEASIKRINSSCDAISKLGKTMSISITPAYRNLKIQEIQIAFEYAQAKQKEKEEQKALRAQMREEAKLQKEIEEQRKIIQKEQTHYQKEIERIEEQLKNNPDDADLKAKLDVLKSLFEETEKSLADIDYREANIKAGYVYIISNIGSFGENVYKIGMTRRLDPQERVDELGDASVPFNFDVHAMIFSDNAPALEAALHRAFEDKKLNLVNHRREFFNVTLDEIKEVVKKNYDKTVEFIDVPDAEQYRVTKSMKEQS